MAAASETGGGRQRPPPFAIELKGISKAFGPVQANKDISIAGAAGHDPRHHRRERRGQVHADVDPLRLLQGRRRARSSIDGKLTAIPDSQSAIRAGIGMVFQHFKLVQNFTVLENVILGVEDGPLLRPSLAKARKVLDELARNTNWTSIPMR